MKIHTPSTRTTVIRFNPICGSPGPVKQAFQPASRTDTVNEIAMVVVVLTSPSWRVTVPFGTITCSATAMSESLSSRLTRELPPEPNLAPVSIKDVYRLVLLQLWTQHDDQKTPWNVLGRYWVNRKAAVCLPSRHASRPDPAFESAFGFTAWVPLVWTSL